MSAKWVVKKVLRNRSYRVEFQVYMEDTRDAMCDSLAPQWERNPDRNRIRAEHIDGAPMMVVDVPANIGNECYRRLCAVETGWESILNQAYLDVAAYHEDFDAYSDTYKDIYGVRPHYTQKEWQARIQAARTM